MPASTPTLIYTPSNNIFVAGTVYNLTAYEVGMINGPVPDLAAITTVTPSVPIDGTTLIGTFTVNSGADTFTVSVDHDLAAFRWVKFTTTGTLPGSLLTSTIYAVSPFGLTANSGKLYTMSGSYPDITYTDVDIGAAAGSGVHSIHAGATAFAINGAGAFPAGIYDSIVSFYPDQSLPAHEHAIRWVVSDAITNSAVFDGFLGPINEDPTVRDIRVDLRGGAVDGYYFTTDGLTLQIGTDVNAWVMFHDSLAIYTNDVSHIRLEVLPLNNFNAPPLFEAAVADPVEQFGAAGTGIHGGYPSVYAYPLPLRIDSADLRTVFAAINAPALGNAATGKLACTGILHFTRGGTAYRSRPFLVTFAQ